MTVASGATFDVTGNVGFTSIQNLAGGGTVQLSDGLFIANASGTFSGIIAGSGASAGLEIGGGTLTLTGANTYAGPTQIDAGATLVLSGSGSIANTSFVSFLGGGTLDISQTTSGAAVGGLFGSAAGIVNLGGQTLTISGSGSFFDGVIQGSGGGLVITGGATQELRGTNTYTGATTIGANSTLSLSNAGSIAASSGVNLTGAFATFDISLGTGTRRSRP